MWTDENIFMDLIEEYSGELSEQHLLRTKEDFVYIADPETYELLYVSMDHPEELIPVLRDYKGRKCYEALQGLDAPCPFCTNPLLRYDQYYIWTHRNDITGRDYLLKDILVDWNGKPARMEIVMDADDRDRLEKSLLENIKSRNVLLDTTNFLLEADNLRGGLQNVIARICELFGACGGSIQIFQKENLLVEWFRNGFYVPSYAPTEVTFQRWAALKKQPRMIYVPQISTAHMNEELRRKYQRQKVTALAVMPIVAEGGLLGVMQIYNPSENLPELSQAYVYAVWISKMVSSFDLKESLHRMRVYDPLLGCYNLEGFRAKAAELLAKEPGWRYALARYDIRYFRLVNDRYGFDTGDELLRYLSSSIASTLREGEIYGRISSDNLCVLRRYRHVEELQERFDWINERLRGFVPFKESLFEPELVNGVAFIKSEKGGINQALDDATSALKQAKQIPGSQLVLFSDTLSKKLEREDFIRQNLKSAVSQGHVRVYFQPQYSYTTGEIVGAEALARWIDPALGSISPAEFIPVLEKCGRVFELDLFIWEETCRYLRAWRERLGADAVPSISVNVSRLDIYQPGLRDTLLAMVEHYSLGTKQLRLEITETAYTDTEQKLIDTIQDLKEHGFTVEMDDFGSGYSSLNVLSDVPVDLLKLDIRFLDYGNNSKRQGGILSSVVRMARWMELPVIAEGVETQEQAEFLKNIGCDMMQGFYFARPLPAAEFEALITSGTVHPGRRSIAARGILNAQEFLDPNSQTSLLFECMGAAAVVELFENQMDGLMINDDFFKLIGVSRVQYAPYQKNMQDFLTPECREKLLQAARVAVEKGEYNGELYLDMVPHPGKGLWVFLALRLISTIDKRHVLLFQLRDISELKTSNRDLQRHQELFRILSEAPGTMTFEYDCINDRMEFHVYSPETGVIQFEGEEYLAGYIHTSQRIPPQSREAVSNMLRTAAVKPTNGTLDCQLCILTEAPRYSRVHYISLANEQGRVYQVVGRVEDLEEELQKYKEQLEAQRVQAMQDPLTKLWNSGAIGGQVEHHLQSGLGGALLLFDLDDFAAINRRHGHLTGDRVLQNFACMLRQVFGSDAELGRVGGDEFVVFLPREQNVKRLNSLAKTFFVDLNVALKSGTAVATASIGGAMVQGQATYEALYTQARQALMKSKQSGKGSFACCGGTKRLSRPKSLCSRRPGQKKPKIWVRASWPPMCSGFCFGAAAPMKVYRRRWLTSAVGWT